MRRSFSRELGSLDMVFAFAHEFESGNGIDDSNSYFLDLTLEELFTNIVRHARGADEVEIELSIEGDLLTISLIDRETQPFDGNALGEVDTSAPLMERQPGGLGIHLVKKMADSLDYVYDDGTLTVTATKRLEED
jgi:anti-sigma regulatory factor (Ser/Thr protein kinase)